MNINTDRITNNVNALKTIQSILLRNNNYISSEQIRETCAKYRISRDLLTRAVELNYVKKLDVSKYKFILIDIQPIHARKIIEKQNELVRNSQSKKSKLKVTKENNSIVIENKSRIPYVKSEKIQPTKEKKRISILWGLFSWSKN